MNSTFLTIPKFYVKSVAPAALFLAAKVEEQPRKLDYVIKVAHACLHPQEPPPDTRSEVSGAWGPASQPRRCWDPQSDAPRPGALRGGSPFTHLHCRELLGFCAAAGLSYPICGRDSSVLLCCASGAQVPSMAPC